MIYAQIHSSAQMILYFEGLVVIARSAAQSKPNFRRRPSATSADLRSKWKAVLRIWQLGLSDPNSVIIFPPPAWKFSAADPLLHG
jgi:hypothetical protein